MSRLTYKLDEPIKTKYLNYEYNRIPDHDIMRGNLGRISDDMIFNKLGKLEDLEDELGCPLEVVVKLRTAESIIVKGYGNEFETLETDDFYLIWEKEPYIEIMKYYEPFRSYKLKDYGKTWWLKSDRSE